MVESQAIQAHDPCHDFGRSRCPFLEGGHPMIQRSGMAAVVAMACLFMSASGRAVEPQQAAHDPDFRKCKKCSAALAKAFAYLKANYKNPQTKRVIGSMAGGYMMGGFAFMMEGNSAKELEDCVK